MRKIRIELAYNGEPFLDVMLQDEDYETVGYSRFRSWSAIAEFQDSLNLFLASGQVSPRFKS